MSRSNRTAAAVAGDDARPEPDAMSPDALSPDAIPPEGAPSDGVPSGAEAPKGEGLAEVEYGGRMYAVPHELKGALMRHADYTRKTQALAQHRQALEAAAQALADHAADLHGDLLEHGRVALLQDHIGQMSQLNWPALQQQNPAEAQALMHQLFQLRQAHEIAAARLQHKRAVEAFDRQREHAKQVEHAHAVAMRDIDGWSPQLAGRLAQYALDQGITPDELSALADPRLIKVLHHAWLHHEAEQQKSAAERLTRAQAVRPAIEVGGTGGGPKDPNRMSTDEWMRHRRSQVRSKTR